MNETLMNKQAIVKAFGDIYAEDKEIMGLPT